MVRIGWLQQDIGIMGGAEMSCQALINGKPEWAEIIFCPHNRRPPDDIDCFVIQNSTNYTEAWIEELARRPVIRHVRDPWLVGNSVLKRWLWENAALMIFSSPTQFEWMDYEKAGAKVKFIPVPVDLEPFIKARDAFDGEREGAVCVGRFDIYKGAASMIDWSLANKIPLTIIGDASWSGNGKAFGKLPDTIRFAGHVPYEQVPELLAQAKYYVAMPMWVEAFGRSVAEAWAAGCELVLRGRVGAQYWIENYPDELGLEKPVKAFWDAVEEVLK